MKLSQIAVAALLLCETITSLAAPQATTNGPCSGIAAAGGTVNTSCTFKILDDVPKRRLVVQQAWLIPTPGFMAPTLNGKRDEQAALTIVVRNLADHDLLINSARLEVFGAKAIAVKGGMIGGDALSSAIGGTNPIRIEAGATRMITLGETIELPNIINGIEGLIDVEGVMVIDELVPPRSNGARYIEDISQLMSGLYGKGAFLRASLFTGDYKLVARFDIPLAKGSDFFYKGERFDGKLKRHTYQPMLAYDAFLGCYLKQREVWVVGFKIKETPKRCIQVMSDSSVPGGLLYSEASCNQSEQKPTPKPTYRLGSC